MKNIFIFILFSFIFTSCATKVKTRINENIKSLEEGTRIIKQEKDSIVYVPKIIKKDTTIIIENKNVVLKSKYSKGNIIRVVCEQKEKNIVEEYTKSEKKDTVIVNKEKTPFEFKEIYIFYFFGFIVIMKIIDKMFDKIF